MNAHSGMEQKKQNLLYSPAYSYAEASCLRVAATAKQGRRKSKL